MLTLSGKLKKETYAVRLRSPNIKGKDQPKAGLYEMEMVQAPMAALNEIKPLNKQERKDSEAVLEPREEKERGALGGLSCERSLLFSRNQANATSSASPILGFLSNLLREESGWYPTSLNITIASNSSDGGKIIPFSFRKANCTWWCSFNGTFDEEELDVGLVNILNNDLEGERGKKIEGHRYQYQFDRSFKGNFISCKIEILENEKDPHRLEDIITLLVKQLSEQIKAVSGKGSTMELASSQPMPVKQQLTAKFVHGLKATTPVTARTGVSVNNTLQTQEDFGAFVDLINRHQPKVDLLKITLTGHLYRHYFGEKFGKLSDQQWREENLKHLERLLVKYELESWAAILENKEYKAIREGIERLYKEDKDFQKIVKRSSAVYANKYKVEEQQAVEFLLEEAAGFLIYQQDAEYFLYPSTKLNDAIAYVLKHEKSSLKYCAYALEETVHKPRVLRETKAVKKPGV